VRPGDYIRCPGIQDDRRRTDRGDRRREPRPCPHRFGRAGVTGAYIRVLSSGSRESSLYLECPAPYCHKTLELIVPAAEAA
jgi:hypothetical protein